MPPIIIGAAIAGAATVGASAIAASAQKKAAKNAEDLAREQQQTAITEQRRLEEKFGLTPGELGREQRLLGIPQGEEAVKFGEQGLEATRQKELERRAGLPGEELLREMGPETRRLLSEISGRFGKTGEELFKAEGEIPRALTGQVLAETQDPRKFYEDTLAPELEQARMMVNAEANRRGVFGGLPEGGIRFEQLGRAGVDLAVKSARDRLNQRQLALSNAANLAGIFQNLSAGARGEAGTVAERALTSRERASAELAQFLQDMEQQSAASKGRAASAGIGAANILQPSIAKSYSDLQGIEGFRGGIVGPGEAGLSAIGDMGSQILLDKLLTPAAKTPPPSSTYEELLKSSAQTSPKQRLSDITGSELEDELYNIRRGR